MTMRARVLMAVASAALFGACDKEPLEENVYTGRPLGGGLDASASPLDAAIAPVPPADATLGDSAEPPVPDALAESVERRCGARPAPVESFDKRAWLASAAQCARREYCESSLYQDDLAAKARAYASMPSEETRAAAQRAYRLANTHVQRTELLRFGPAAPRMEPGGQNLRAQIYAFPDFDRCLIDEQTLARTYAEPTFPQTPESGRGLGAVEYALFYEGLDNGCSPISILNQEGRWATLSATPEELRARRRDYAARAAEEVANASRALLAAWDPAQGNFTRTFSEPAPGAVLANEQAAINTLGRALYYIDREFKDTKLGVLVPGLTEECRSGCPDRREGRYAQVTTASLLANLEGFRLLFQGCSTEYRGLGFDDALVALGPAGESLAQRMIAALDNAERAIRALQPPIEVASTQDPARIDAVYRAVKMLTDLLKTELITLLDIELPMAAEGDND